MNPELPTDHDDVLAERGRALLAETMADVHAPAELRHRVEAQRARASRTRARARLLVGGSLATALAASAVAIVLVLSGSGTPTVLAVADLGTRAPALPAPARDRADPTLLRAQIDGVRFPFWGGDLGWEVTGARTDEVEGRATRTLYYQGRSGRTASYAIVAGDPLDPPDEATRRTVATTTFAILRQGDRHVIAWQRLGHTCIMSAPVDVPLDRLLTLAAYQEASA